MFEIPHFSTYKPQPSQNNNYSNHNNNYNNHNNNDYNNRNNNNYNTRYSNNYNNRYNISHKSKAESQNTVSMRTVQANRQAPLK